MTRRNVEFKSRGVTCRAWLYEPDTSITRPAPSIVMAHGLGGTRRDALEPYAQRFCEAGFFVLVFDYRHQGDSDGEPRQLISIPRQLQDWAAAIALARRWDGIDPRRIALWGTSLSGGHVVIAAARDPRVAAIAAQCPMMDGAASARMALKATGPGTSVRLVWAATNDAVRSLLGMRPKYVPVVAPPGGLAAMASHDAYAGYIAIAQPNWRNEVAARLFLRLPFYRPMSYAKAVTCPSLILVCLKDSVTSTRAAEDVAARIGDKARLGKLPSGHCDIYKGAGLERSSQEQVKFFKDALHA
ncbi:MAG: alpha/beta hydrolase [Hyphomicrobium sp.]